MKNNIVLDALKRPAAVGDTILTTGYGSTSISTVATITRINKNDIMVRLPASHSRRIEDSTSPWGFRYEYITEDKPMRRRSDQFLIINEQLEYNKTNFPEYYI